LEVPATTKELAIQSEVDGESFEKEVRRMNEIACMKVRKEGRKEGR
jgi:hypothetical protein